LTKYGDESGALWYWWYDEDSVAELNDSIQMKTPLPSRPPSVRFDEVFIGK
jgi:hypothetical protein